MDIFKDCSHDVRTIFSTIIYLTVAGNVKEKLSWKHERKYSNFSQGLSSRLRDSSRRWWGLWHLWRPDHLLLLHPGVSHLAHLHLGLCQGRAGQTIYVNVKYSLERYWVLLQNKIQFNLGVWESCHLQAWSAQVRRSQGSRPLLYLALYWHLQVRKTIFIQGRKILSSIIDQIKANDVL